METNNDGSALDFKKVESNEVVTLVPIMSQGKRFQVIITADVNDADYVATVESYDEEEFITLIPELKDLVENGSGSHMLSDWYHLEGELNIPADGDDNAHTLESIEITCIDIDGKIHNVRLKDVEDIRSVIKQKL